jgi:hypothetical protein
MTTTETPTGYGKRLNQLSADEMAWWHKNSFQPQRGGVYICRRANKEHGTKMGRVYVYDGDSLRTYTSRNVNVLLNGYNTLRQPYAFEVHGECPFCGSQVFDPIEGKQVMHDVMKCEKSSNAAAHRQPPTTNKDSNAK